MNNGRRHRGHVGRQGPGSWLPFLDEGFPSELPGSREGLEKAHEKEEDGREGVTGQCTRLEGRKAGEDEALSNKKATAVSRVLGPLPPPCLASASRGRPGPSHKSDLWEAKCGWEKQLLGKFCWAPDLRWQCRQQLENLCTWER